MASGLRLVWSSSSVRRAPDSAPLRVGSPPSRASSEARALIDDWLGAAFEDGSDALDDLVARIAHTLERRAARVALQVADVEIGSQDRPSSP